jgi:hypothetical protein
LRGVLISVQAKLAMGRPVDEFGVPDLVLPGSDGRGLALNWSTSSRPGCVPRRPLRCRYESRRPDSPRHDGDHEKICPSLWFTEFDRLRRSLRLRGASVRVGSGDGPGDGLRSGWRSAQESEPTRAGVGPNGTSGLVPSSAAWVTAEWRNWCSDLPVWLADGAASAMSKPRISLARAAVS